MRKEEKAALDVLAKAADVYNCWAILDDAVESGEDDQFTKEYIDGEREMLEGSIKGTIRALGTLGGLYGIAISTQNDNGSYAYMRKVREEHLTELERGKEFERGYRAGRRAMDAKRQAIALKLRGLDLTGSSHENLSRIAYAIYPCATGWTPESCEGLRDKLVRLLGGVNERETTFTTCDALDNERHKAICELRKMTIDSHYYGNYQRIALAIGVTYDGERFASECVRDRLIHLLGGDVCEGGDHGDCAERRRAGAAGGDTDMDEPSEIRAISNEISDLLSEMDAESDTDGTCPNDVPTPSITDELREMDNGHSRTCPKSDEEVSESAPSMSITDELREFKGHINAELTPEMVLALRAEINCIADRIDEQLKTIRQNDYDECQLQTDKMRAMLTEQRDAARAKVIALCNERDEWKRGSERDADKLESLVGAYNDMERERDELKAKLNELEKFDADTSLAAFGDDNDELRRLLSRAAKLLANAEQDRDANYAYWMDCKEKVVHANTTIEELQAKLDGIAGVLDG